MDHIPRPNSAPSNPFKVPLLLGIQYDGNGFTSFTSFPIRHGYNLETLESDHSLDEVASFVQAWLYFGLLAEFLQKPLDPMMFRGESEVDGTMHAFLSSKNALKALRFELRPLEDDQDSDYEDDANDENTREKNRLLQLLSFANEQCTKIDMAYHDCSHDILAVVLLSVRVLIETLHYVSVGSPLEVTSFFLAPNAIRPTLTKKFLKDLMTVNRWCPVQIDYILRTFNHPLIYFISQIRRFHRPEITHRDCYETCTAYNIAEEDNVENHRKKYKTRHVNDACQCPLVPIPADMKQILACKKIPLVFLKKGEHDSIKLGVKAAEADDTYVAFSHVWYDGLGNQEENSLPECQIKRLARYLEKTPPLGVRSGFLKGHMWSWDIMRLKKVKNLKYFWIDTLCIPVDTPGGPGADENKNLKALAIEKIAPTFARASRVIILDYEMENFMPKCAESYERTVRLLFSAWAGRCWTLQEGALNRGCYVQLSDSILDPNDLVKDRSRLEYIISSTSPGSLLVALTKVARDVAMDLMQNVFCHRAYEQKKYARNFEKRILRMLQIPLEQEVNREFLMYSESREDEFEWETSENFTFVWNSLSRRQTSKPKDRVTILASLADLNTFQVKKFRIPMMALLRSIPVLPVSMLYISNIDIIPNEVAPEDNVNGNDVGKTRNGWLPLLPNRATLREMPVMKWNNEWLELDDPRGTDLLLIDTQLWNPDGLCELFLEARSESEQCRYRVEFMEPYVANDRSMQISLLTEGDCSQENLLSLKPVFLRGACLQVLEVNFQDVGSTLRTQVVAVYKGPIRLWPCVAEGAGEGDGEILHAYEKEEFWSLKLRHSSSSRESRLTSA
jgi:hypothetical protein